MDHGNARGGLQNWCSPPRHCNLKHNPAIAHWHQGKISCQPGEWLLVYGQWEVGKSLMVLWDGLWLFPPALLQSRALSVTLPLLSLLPFLNGRRASMEKRKAEFCWMIKSLKWLLCKNNKNKRKRRGKKRWQGESLSHKRGLNKINKATSKH